jgi:hypothetical protein
MPSPDGVLVAAIGLVLTGAGLPEVATLQNGHTTGTGFLAVLVTGGDGPVRCGHLVRGRQVCCWPGWADRKAPRLRAGAPPGRVPRRVRTQSTGGCLLARRGTRGR